MHYQIAIEINPDFPNSYYNLGLVCISLKNFPEARKALNTYIEQSAEDQSSVAHQLLNTLNSLSS
jgi:tetratricopeptide (TPR) repeat protein